VEIASPIDERPGRPGSHSEWEQLLRENAELRAELQRRAEREQQLCNSEARFRTLAETMPQFVWTCDGEGRCDYLGPQWIAYTGIPEAEQLGHRWLDNLHPGDRERVNSAWSNSASAGAAFDVDFRIRRADGAYRWFKTRALPKHDAQGQITQWLGTNTDIDELRQAEQQVRLLTEGLEAEVALRTAELRTVSERLFAATSAANVGLWDWDLVNDVVVWDERMYRIHGLAPTDFSSAVEAWGGTVHPDDAAAARIAIDHAVAGTATFDISVRVLTPSGEVRHVRSAASVFRDSDGRPFRVLGASWDVTAEMATQERLKINEERWDLALQGTGDGVWDFDLVKEEIFLSRRSKELLGYAPDALVDSKNKEDLVHPADRLHVAATMERHLQGETPLFECEYRRLCGDGSYLWILARGRVIARDRAGKPLRIVGTHRDIAERRQAQEALKNREVLLREFITYTPAAIAMLDRDMRYVQASRRWLSDYKVSGEDIIGRCHYDVFPDVPERWREIHRRVLAGSVESCAEDPFPRADGGIEWLQWEARPWHEADGQIGGLIFFTQVITERKELGIQLEEQNRQLANSNAELEQFAYVASHDLQEPLRAVAGCTQILAQRYKGRLDSDADALVAHIVDGSSRMKALIEDLLSLSRVSSQGEPPRQVDTADVFRRAMTHLQGRVEEQGAQVSTDALPVIRGDFTQLVQLFQNLIGNALKYRRAGVAPQVSVTARRSATEHEFCVRDNGIGIDSQYFERIFGVFQRLHTRDEYPGTGIGLAICRKIVERHGGRIWIESTVGRGSAFHFTLPTEGDQCQ
jgi:PAS domain S-box-containing protein